MYFKLTLQILVNHNASNEEVNNCVDEDIKHNLIQQSLLDAIRHFNMCIEYDRKGNIKLYILL